MKVYISADMEGIWGITQPDMVRKGTSEYERGRKLMTDEVNLVIEYLFEHGAEEILVNDSHGPMTNILIESLDNRASLISGSVKPHAMMEGLDASFDGVVLIGYHPRAITEKGIFDHTYSGKLFRNIAINGQSLGEGGLNARLAAYYDVPVLLVSGDDVFCEQMKQEIGTVQSVATKRTISRFTARNIPYSLLRTRYQNAISKALDNPPVHAGIDMKGSFVCEMAFKDALNIENPLLMDFVKKVSDDTVSIESADYETLFRHMLAIMKIA